MTTTYKIKAVSKYVRSLFLDYKGEGRGKNNNFSDDGGREDEEFDSLEYAKSKADSLRDEFDDGWEMRVYMEESDDDGIASSLVYSVDCTKEDEEV